VFRISVISKEFQHYIWGCASTIDFFKNRVPSVSLNKILKRLTRLPAASSNLTALQLFSGRKPIFFEKQLFKSLGKFTSLRVLCFGNKRGGIEYLQDVALSGLTALGNSLTTLDLSYCYGITETGYKNLSCLTGLKTLAMRHVQNQNFDFLPYSSSDTPH
jgi:hypothetical protein